MLHIVAGLRFVKHSTKQQKQREVTDDNADAVSCYSMTPGLAINVTSTPDDGNRLMTALEKEEEFEMYSNMTYDHSDATDPSGSHMTGTIGHMTGGTSHMTRPTGHMTDSTGHLTTTMGSYVTVGYMTTGHVTSPGGTCPAMTPIHDYAVVDFSAKNKHDIEDVYSEIATKQT